MAWISYVAVVLMFYMPMIGLADTVLGITQSPINHVILLAVLLILWIVIMLCLIALKRANSIDILAHADLNRGLLFARLPSLTNSIAIWLAVVFMIIAVGGYLIGLVPGISFSIVVDTKIIPLSLFTLLAAIAFRYEQGNRYEAEIRRNQLERKSRQKEIIIPAGQHLR